MNIVVDKQPKCIAVLNVEVPANDAAAKREAIASNYRSQAKLSGFRPGKAPKNLVEKRFSKQISEELTEALFENACNKAMDEHKLKVCDFGFPDKITERPDGSISFETRLILAPDFDLPDYKGIEIKAPFEEVSEAEIDAHLQELRQRLANFEDISDRALQNDDIAVVDFHTTLDGKSLSEAIGEKGKYLEKRENHWLPVKEGSFLPGYAEQLVGMNEGDQKEVSLTLNEDFPIEDLRGKTLVLHTTLRKVKSMILPELNDEFAATLVPDKTLEDIKELIRTNTGAEKKAKIQEYKATQVVEKLIGLVEFELPEEILQSETQNQINVLVNEGSKQGASDEEMLEKKEEIFSTASQRAQANIRTNFILQAVAQEEGLKVTESDLISRISQIAQARKEPIKKVIKDLQSKRQIQPLRNQLLMARTIDFLVEQAKVTEVSPDELNSTLTTEEA